MHEEWLQKNHHPSLYDYGVFLVRASGSDSWCPCKNLPKPDLHIWIRKENRKMVTVPLASGTNSQA